MRKLILVKHSLPEQVPNIPAKQWQLNKEGRARCKPLAQRLATYQPAIIISSIEPKAVETAQLVAEYLKLSFEQAEGLQEHDRSNTGYLGKAEFEATIARFFEQPETLVMGLETASEAQTRFKYAIESILEKYPEGNLIVVAHGTVISLFVAAATGIAPFPLWQQLGLPSFVVLGLPEQKVLEMVETIEENSTFTLFRPVGQKELDLIQESGYKEFPPRFSFQPIFYPVLNQEYAAQIARDWNTKDAASGYVGYVTRFEVQATFLNQYEIKTVGGKQHQEYWIPAEDLAEFNRNIVGQIDVIAEFRPS